MTLHDAEGKMVKITLDDGQVFSGKAIDYVSAVDNEPLPEAISIGDIELYVDEIVSIEPI